MAKKIDGKEYYTFVGLINRMDTCRNRQHHFGLKDIPEEVEFKGQMFRLSEDKKTYLLVAKDRNGAEFVADDLSDWAAAEYGADLSMYLTAFDFIVHPKETVKATRSEYMLIKYLNMFGNKPATHVSVENVHDYYELDTRKLYLWDGSNEYGLESYTSINVIDIGDGSFIGFEPGVKYKIKNVEVNDG